MRINMINFWVSECQYNMWDCHECTSFTTLNSVYFPYHIPLHNVFCCLSIWILLSPWCHSTFMANPQCVLTEGRHTSGDRVLPVPLISWYLWRRPLTSLEPDLLHCNPPWFPGWLKVQLSKFGDSFIFSMNAFLAQTSRAWHCSLWQT